VTSRDGASPIESGLASSCPGMAVLMDDVASARLCPAAHDILCGDRNV